MKVKLLVSRATETESQAPGSIVEVDDAEALRMVEAELAEIVKVEKEKAIKR